MGHVLWRKPLCWEIDKVFLLMVDPLFTCLLLIGLFTHWMWRGSVRCFFLLILLYTAYYIHHALDTPELQPCKNFVRHCLAFLWVQTLWDGSIDKVYQHNGNPNQKKTASRNCILYMFTCMSYIVFWCNAIGFYRFLSFAPCLCPGAHG